MIRATELRKKTTARPRLKMDDVVDLSGEDSGEELPDLTEDDFVVKVADPLADLFANVEINDSDLPF